VEKETRMEKEEEIREGNKIQDRPKEDKRGIERPMARLNENKQMGRDERKEEVRKLMGGLAICTMDRLKRKKREARGGAGERENFSSIFFISSYFIIL
jgi:hypothetical protein